MNNHEKSTATCASDSGVLPESWPGTEQAFGKTNMKKMERAALKPDKDAQYTTNNPKTKAQPHNPQKWRTIEERWRLESQLATAAPRDSSMLRWIPRGNALAM